MITAAEARKLANTDKVMSEREKEILNRIAEKIQEEAKKGYTHVNLGVNAGLTIKVERKLKKMGYKITRFSGNSGYDLYLLVSW